MIDDWWCLMMIDEDGDWWWLMMIDDDWWWLMMIFVIIISVTIIVVIYCWYYCKKALWIYYYYFMKYKPSQPIGNHPLWPCPFRIVNHFVRSYSMWRIPQPSVAFWRKNGLCLGAWGPCLRGQGWCITSTLTGIPIVATTEGAWTSGILPGSFGSVGWPEGSTWTCWCVL